MDKRKPYDLPELIKRWEREQLTTEQAIGQILVWLVRLATRMTKLEAKNCRPDKTSQ